jgi:hypothetical protein
MLFLGKNPNHDCENQRGNFPTNLKHGISHPYHLMALFSTLKLILLLLKTGTN